MKPYKITKFYDTFWRVDWEPCNTAIIRRGAGPRPRATQGRDSGGAGTDHRADSQARRGQRVQGGAADICH